MEDLIRLVGPAQAVEIFGIRLVGATVENGKKLLFTLIFIAVVLLLRALLRCWPAGRCRGAVINGPGSGCVRPSRWARQCS